MLTVYLRVAGCPKEVLGYKLSDFGISGSSTFAGIFEWRMVLLDVFWVKINILFLLEV